MGLLSAYHPPWYNGEAQGHPAQKIICIENWHEYNNFISTKKTWELVHTHDSKIISNNENHIVLQQISNYKSTEEPMVNIITEQTNKL